jgi:hypothetical protein
MIWQGRAGNLEIYNEHKFGNIFEEIVRLERVGPRTWLG